MFNETYEPIRDVRFGLSEDGQMRLRWATRELTECCKLAGCDVPEVRAWRIHEPDGIRDTTRELQTFVSPTNGWSDGREWVVNLALAVREHEQQNRNLSETARHELVHLLQMRRPEYWAHDRTATDTLGWGCSKMAKQASKRQLTAIEWRHLAEGPLFIDIQIEAAVHCLDAVTDKNLVSLIDSRGFAPLRSHLRQPKVAERLGMRRIVQAERRRLERMGIR